MFNNDTEDKWARYCKNNNVNVTQIKYRIMEKTVNCAFAKERRQFAFKGASF